MTKSKGALKGASPDKVAKSVGAMTGIDWAKIKEIVKKYGPAVVQFIDQLLALSDGAAKTFAGPEGNVAGQPMECDHGECCRTTLTETLEAAKSAGDHLCSLSDADDALDDSEHNDCCRRTLGHLVAAAVACCHQLNCCEGHPFGGEGEGAEEDGEEAE